SGFIIRTACEGLSKREIQGDIRFLLKLWSRILRKSEQGGAPVLLHYDMDLTLRTVRDLFTTDTERLLVDNPRDFQRILDFVDMGDRGNQRQIFDDLNDAFKKDKARSKLLPVSDLGLIELTRKRTRESLLQILCSPCATCDGKGHLKATSTVAYEVLRRI